MQIVNATHIAVQTEFALDRWFKIIASRLRDQENITLNQFWILTTLGNEAEHSISSLARRIDLNYTTVAEAIARLEYRNLIEKNKGDDGRNALLALTNQGRETIAAVDQILVRTASASLSMFTGKGKTETMRLFYNACARLNKVRMMGNFVRGDSAFIIACQQIHFYFDSICRAYLVTPVQGHALLALVGNEAITAKEVRNLLGADPSTLSRALTKLTRQGLVKRLPGVSRREVSLSPTNKGLHCASSIAVDLTRQLQEFFGEDFGSDCHLRTISTLQDGWQEATI